MTSLTTNTVSTYCAYCGAPICLVIDHSIENQEYIEDCEVCCQPLVVNVHIHDDDNIHCKVKREDE
ncbi:CPXCG motif-containing cysteine-rich protein [Marinibactrum halimedae]|uniref:CPXCG motif-containing cysteine-rich protein n=1 Tax=Marinibactrum halimedae TaxID=1444977 RepID=UPI001E647A4A|nr:CPXCG motif-containing cysteine-rich protein [Marinibactrum halimedae]MCD9457473.1 CPXCG motif-containing cysteine-rich protein [Marinibactrum halimedae]